MSRSANNVDLQVGARVAALDITDQGWIFPGIITKIEGLNHTVQYDAGHTITGVTPAHIWTIELAKDYPKLYWGYPKDFTKILSKFSVPAYFNRSIPLRSFGLQLLQGMYLFANKAVFEGKIPQPKWQIAAMMAAGSARRDGLVRISTRALSLRHLFDTVCHECVHLYQFNFVPAAQQRLELDTGLHGATFFAWKEPLAKIGVILTRGDTGDADLEIPDPGKRDKEQLVILRKRGTKWEGGIIANEKMAQQLGLQLSGLGEIISIVRVRGAALMHNMLPVKAKRGGIRLVDVNQNVIDYIRKFGQPMLGFELP
jgi:hypothetical protein